MNVIDPNSPRIPIAANQGVNSNSSNASAASSSAVNNQSCYVNITAPQASSSWDYFPQPLKGDMDRAMSGMGAEDKRKVQITAMGILSGSRSFRAVKQGDEYLVLRVYGTGINGEDYYNLELDTENAAHAALQKLMDQKEDLSSIDGSNLAGEVSGYPLEILSELEWV
ncbi:MAG: hypothetical protein V1843_03775, partial [bacterium]